MQTTLSKPAVDRRGTRRRRLLLAVGIPVLSLALVGGGTLAWLSATAVVHDHGEAECTAATVTGESIDRAGDVAAICATIDGLADAWSAGDAEAYGAAFSEHATYTAFTGTIYQGRDDLVAGHAALFDAFLQGTRLSSRYLGIHLDGDAASVLARGDTYEGEAPPDDLTKVQSYMLTRDEGGTWRIDAFHNTQRSPLMERIQFLFAPGTIPADER